MVGFMSDITDRRAAEEELRAAEDRLRTVVEFAADGFMLHAADGSIVDVNRQVCENLGYAREELLGMTPAGFDADLDPAAVKAVSDRIGAGATVTIETHHRRKDGTTFPVELRLRRVRQGGQWLTISLVRDITERRRLEEERDRLRRLEADLERTNRLTTMGELTASIAHEVNQPLGAMVANAAACERWLAAERPQLDKVRSVLKSIAADGQRASMVIGRIRALMKRQAPRRDPMDIGEAIREVIALSQQQMRRHAVVLQTRLADRLPPIEGDKVQLQQVLLNLIIDAIEAMSGIDGRPRELTLVSRRDGGSVVVDVRDSGTGLDAAHAERLFEPFYTTKEDGMGVGLAISRSIVEAHGGRLGAAPNVPHGAVFHLSLPLRD
jgi:PAS domain S-box-containing protein